MFWRKIIELDGLTRIFIHDIQQLKSEAHRIGL